MNEEDVRGKILLPFLSDLGFDESEIFLEHSFTIRLGKSVIKTGRSDILCKRNGQNLFVIELKKDSKSIDQNDIDQGISYSRLLQDNIAPFTIITNGLDTKIFDSVSRRELTGDRISESSSFWKSGCTLSTDIDLRIRYEALKKFVSFSPENLKLFCRNQVQDRMGAVIGGIEHPYSKFIKELHVQRKDLCSTFSNFINSRGTFFGLVGNAGVGKTNAVCSLALQYLEKAIVFFYNAALINKSPLEQIAQDLNLVFSSRTESDIILKKLDELGRFLNQDVIIFLDAIDEHTGYDLALELSEIALMTKNLEKVKICISCKSNVWNSFLKKNDNPTHLFEELRKFHPFISSLNNCPGFLLEDFSEEELDAIIPLYQDAFGWIGQISNSILKELRNGFFLRIFSEVYSYKEIPQEINDKTLIKKYLKQSLDKTQIGYEKGIRMLSKIGRALIDHSYNSLAVIRDDGLDIESLLEKISFQTDESISEDLFARNILIRSYSEDSYNVTFYYSKIRDFVLCFFTFKLDKLNNDVFYDSLEIFYENHIGQSAISFYIQNSSQSHKLVLAKFIKDKALRYVIGYSSFLDNNFRNIKAKFDPETEGKIGIFLPENLLLGHGYALFPIDFKSQEIVQTKKFDLRATNDNLFFKHGVKCLHGSYHSLLVKDQEKNIRERVFKQLKEIVDKGRISVYNSEVLLLEQVSTILYFYYKKLGYDFTKSDVYLPRFDSIYPLDLVDLKNRLFKFRSFEYFKRESYGREHRYDPESIKIKADWAVKNNIEIPPLNIHGDFPPFEELNKIVDILIKKGYSALKNHHLPCPDISVLEINEMLKNDRIMELSTIRSSQFSKSRASLYVEAFLKYLDVCYCEFIDETFPTFKEKFEFYSTSPHEFFLYMKDEDILKGGLLGYRKSKSHETEIHYRKLTPGDEPFESGETKVLLAFSLDHVIHCHYNNVVMTVDHLRTPKVDEFCVLRNYVYKFLKQDFKKIYKEFDL